MKPSTSFRFIVTLSVLGTACGGVHRSTLAAPVSPETAPVDRALDGIWVELQHGSMIERYEFRGGVRVLLGADGTFVERASRQREVSSGKFFVSWREANEDNHALLLDFTNQLASGAAPTSTGSDIWQGHIIGFGHIAGGSLSFAEAAAGETNPAWEEDTFFDGQTLSYTYENGKSFTNEFQGEHRFTMTRRRGRLDEVSVVRALGGGSFMVSWVDTNLGHITQVIDLQNQTVHAAVPLPGRSEIWRASITRMPEPIPAEREDPEVVTRN